MAGIDKYRKEALEAKPSDTYEISPDKLTGDDLVWSWTSKEFLRADSPLWKFSPLIYREEIICVVRRVSMGAFEQSVPTKRSFKLKSDNSNI